MISKEETVRLMEEKEARRAAKEAKLLAKERAKRDKLEPGESKKHLVIIERAIKRAVQNDKVGLIMTCNKKSKYIPFDEFLERLKRTQLDILRAAGYKVEIREANEERRYVKYLIQWAPTEEDLIMEAQKRASEEGKE